MEHSQGNGVARPLVGILGGMGPAATADFYAKLVRATPAGSDQEHLRVVIWSDPSVPDRTAALLNGGPDPGPAIEQGVRSLKAAGATLIVVACNTAHAFLDDVDERVGVPIVHMIEEAVRTVLETRPLVTRVGVLATKGTIAARLYQDELARVGLEARVPFEAEQRDVSRAITLVKANKEVALARPLLTDAARSLVDRGAEVLIAGCTEIPLMLCQQDVAVPVIDPAMAAAEAVITQVWRPAPPSAFEVA